MKLFGFNITRNQEEIITNNSMELPELKEDGSMEFNPSFYGYDMNFDFKLPENENFLINKYRELSKQPEFVKAIDHIINEAFSYDEDAMPVDVNMDDVKGISDSTKKKIKEEFDRILMMMDFNYESYDLFKKWYVDGRIYFQKVVDEKNLKKGIQKIKFIDPRKIRKVRMYDYERNRKDYKIINSIEMNRKIQEFFLYNPRGFNNAGLEGIALFSDNVCYVNSGIFSEDNKTLLSHLHQSIRFYNVLRSVEDSMVMLRLTRSTEKRVFNVEVGDLPTHAADSLLRKTMERFRKKIEFDPQTGEIKEQKKFISLLEDWWFPKRDGKGTTVDILSQGENLGQIEDIEYFKKKFFESLNVPISRLDTTSSMFSIGRSTELSRDELAFSKFVSRLRKRFSTIFHDLLKTQLLLKGIVNLKEWNSISRHIVFDFKQDNHFTELKWSEIYSNRFNAMRDAGDYIGDYVSKDWIRKNILRMTEEEAKEEVIKIAKEKELEEPDEEEVDQNNPQSLIQKPEPKASPVKEKEDENDPFGYKNEDVKEAFEELVDVMDEKIELQKDIFKMINEDGDSTQKEILTKWFKDK